MTANQRIKLALTIAYEYGGIDGDHHGKWIVDQIVRGTHGGRLRRLGQAAQPRARGTPHVRVGDGYRTMTVTKTYDLVEPRGELCMANTQERVSRTWGIEPDDLGLAPCGKPAVYVILVTTISATGLRRTNRVCACRPCHLSRRYRQWFQIA